MKLTKAQEKIYEEIKNNINLAKECETFKEYYIKKHCFGNYSEDNIKSETAIFERYEEELTKNYKSYWLEAREKNIALTHCSSSTLRVLEKKGLIKIVEDGKKYIDKVILL